MRKSAVARRKAVTEMRAVMATVALAGLAVAGSGCRTAKLSRGAESVSAGRNAAPPQCTSVGYLTGRGGGSFGGAWVSNEKLVEYAINDLRNQAAELRANYVHHDPPQMGHADGTTSTVTITGTAYQCPQGAPQGAQAASPPPPPPQAAPAPTAQPAPTGAGASACEPPCSPGFACENGSCIPQCNPPCEVGEICSRDRTCVAAGE